MAQSGTSADELTGAVDATADVFVEHGDFVRAVIRSRIRDESIADDIFQDFFLSLVCNPPPAVPDMKGFLYRAIIHDIADARRRVAIYRKHMDRYAERPCQRGEEGVRQSDLMETEETNRVLEIIEMIVSRRQAQAVTLRYRTGYDIDEIAGEMNVDRQTVRRYICVALRRARRFFSVAWDAHDDSIRSR
ncbi:MAG: sigma-70 family RNA polymerase sigma factor [Phycisphaerales bacterium]|nr:MAG: sigma-70 family RNA polymerase sigma factor [Phycisphaerales bacterium]